MAARGPDPVALAVDELLPSLPYLTMVAVLAWRRSGTRPPATLGVPYRR